MMTASPSAQLKPVVEINRYWYW